MATANADQSFDDSLVQSGSGKNRPDQFETSTPAVGEKYKHVTIRKKKPVASDFDAHREGWKVLHYIQDRKAIEDVDMLETIRDQALLINEMVQIIIRDAKRLVFDDKEFLQTELEIDNPDILAKIYGVLNDLFREGFVNFNSGTHVLVQDHMDRLISVFKVHCRGKARIIEPFIKFIIIGLTFGVDRAMFSVQNKDDMYFEFTHDKGDAYFRKLCDIQNKELDRSRDIYYTCFRTDGFDPRREIEARERMEENKIRIGKEQQKLADYFKNVKENPAHSSSIRVQGSGASMATIIKNEESGNSDYDSDSDSEIEIVRKSRKSKRVRINPPPAKPLHLVRAEACQSDQADDEDSGDDGPAIPVHIRKGAADPYFGKTKQSLGKVYDPNTAFKEVENPSTDVWNQTIKGLVSAGVDKKTVKDVVATSAAMAQIAGTLTSSYKKQNKKVIEEIPPPKKEDYRADSFDYDIEGDTIQKVLGKRFCKIQFPSEAIKNMVMRDILEKVASHPASTFDAKLIANNYLGEDDPLQRRKAEMQTIMSESFYASPEGDEAIPPPRLGRNDLTSDVLKTLQTRVGMSQNDRFDFQKMTNISLRSLLSNLRSVISSFGLRESEAYTLMSRVTTGICHEAVWLAQHEHKIPFKDYWMSLQKTQSRAMASQVHKDLLKGILNQKYVNNLEQSLNEILIYNSKLHQNETDPNIRRVLCQRDTLKDFRTFIRRHYPSYASQVNTTFVEKLRLAAIKRNDPSMINENEYHAGVTLLFLETASEVLNQAEPESNMRRYEEKYEKPFHKKFGRINEIKALVEEVSALASEVSKNRQTDQSGRSGLNKNQKSKKHDIEGMVNVRKTGKQGTSFSCYLCTLTGHSYRECRRYPGEKPGNKECPKCHGRHISDCKADVKLGRGLPDQKTKSSAKIMEVSPQNQQRNYGQYQGNNYNNYNRQSGDYRSFRPNNSQQNYQNNYRRYDQNESRENRGNFFKGNRSGYRGNFNNKPRSGFFQKNNNQGTQEQSPQRIDQRQIKQLEELVKSMKQQQFVGHTNGPSTGLGNDGHQPLNATVVLDVVEGNQ